MKIINIKARQIIDSRGNPTIEVDVFLEDGSFGRSSVPSGASTGIFEAFELRDNNKSLYLGKSVLNAVNNVNTEIKNLLIDKDAFNQKEIDNLLIKLDGTKNKSRLGANAILAVSIAVAKASANSKKLELFEYLSKNNVYSLPIPMMNILNGGAHASNNVDIQEFMISPTNPKSFQEGLRQCVEVFHTLKEILKENNTPATGVGDEGGYAPNLSEDEEALELITKAINKAGYVPGIDFNICIDAASSEWYDKDKDLYILPKSNMILTKEELVKKWENLIEKYPISSIEDGMGEEDYLGWQLLTKAIGNKVQLVGDDLFVTNVERLEKGINLKIANAILIKPNQIGTISETLATIKMAQASNYKVIISHRSGETEDSFIADLSVAVNANQIKSGAPSRSERLAKYNQLLRIEEKIGEN